MLKTPKTSTASDAPNQVTSSDALNQVTLSVSSIQYDLLSTFGDDSLMKRDGSLAASFRSQVTMENIIREIVQFKSENKESLHYKSNNSKTTNYLISVPVPKCSGKPDVSSATKEFNSVLSTICGADENKMVKQVMSALVETNKEAVVDFLCEATVVVSLFSEEDVSFVLAGLLDGYEETVLGYLRENNHHNHQKMSAYQVAATLTKCNIKISQWFDLVQCLKTFLNIRSCLLVEMI
jgi:hypothetical protein